MNLVWPRALTGFLGKNFINATTVILTGSNSCNSKRLNAEKFIFPHLRYFSGPQKDLLNNTFDASCEMPTLRRLGIWIEDGVQLAILLWKQLLAQSDLGTNPELLEIHDMDPIAASSILKYLLEPGRLPQLTLFGRRYFSRLDLPESRVA